MICMCCDITCALQYILLINWVGCQGGARCARVTLSRLNAAHYPAAPRFLFRCRLLRPFLSLPSACARSEPGLYREFLLCRICSSKNRLLKNHDLVPFLTGRW